MTKVVDDLSSELSSVIQNEVAKAARVRATELTTMTAAAPVEAARDKAPRLPRRIDGGFSGLNSALDERSREWRSIVRTLNHQKMQVEAAEAERDRLNAVLARLMPELQDATQSLSSLLSTTKEGDVSGDLSAQFAANERVLTDLETLAEALSTNLLGLRSTWEQYARTIIRAQRMREEAGTAVLDPVH